MRTPATFYISKNISKKKFTSKQSKMEREKWPVTKKEDSNGMESIK